MPSPNKSKSLLMIVFGGFLFLQLSAIGIRAENDNSQSVPLTTHALTQSAVRHAIGSGNPSLILQAAQALLDQNDLTAAAETALQAFAKIKTAKTEEKRLDILLGVAELLKAAGRDRLPEYNKIIKDLGFNIVGRALDETSPVFDFYLAIRLDHAVGSNYTKEFIGLVTKRANEKIPVLQHSLQASWKTPIGSLKKDGEQRILWKYLAAEWHVNLMLIFGLEGGSYLPQRLIVAREGGIVAVYDKKENGFVLVSQSNRGLATVHGKPCAADFFLPPKKPGEILTLSNENDWMLVWAIDLNTRFAKVTPIFPMQKENPSDLEDATPAPSFSWNNNQGRPIHFSGEVHSYLPVTAADMRTIEERMLAYGTEPLHAQRLVAMLKIKGQPAYQAGKAVFIGDEAMLKSGNYVVWSYAYFQNTKDILIYRAEYQNQRLKRADLSDGQILTDFQGGTDSFSAILKTGDQKRTHLTLYRKGAVVGSKLVLDEFGAEILYDEKGNLLSESLQQLRSEFPGFEEIKANDYIFAFDPLKDFFYRPMIGFKLKKTSSGQVQEEAYSLQGRRFNGRDYDEGGIQTVIEEYDVQQKMAFNLPQYNRSDNIKIKLVKTLSKKYLVWKAVAEGKAAPIAFESNALGMLK